VLERMTSGLSRPWKIARSKAISKFRQSYWGFQTL